MSSSPSLSPPASHLPKVQSFPYAPVGDGAKSVRSLPFAGTSPDSESGDDLPGQLLAAQSQARAEGREAGRAEVEKALQEQVGKERAAIAAALAQFTHDRAVYFQKVEAEVVQLALNIARKILHREAQVDPILLAGIVRVALEQIDGATGVVLRLHPENAASWRTYLSTHLDPADLPQLLEDAGQPLDRCVLETSMGTAAMGLDIQLKEIEQGLMDLLASRPGVGP